METKGLQRWKRPPLGAKGCRGRCLCSFIGPHSLGHVNLKAKGAFMRHESLLVLASGPPYSKASSVSVRIWILTLPPTNMAPVEVPGRLNFLLKGPPVSCHVSGREGNLQFFEQVQQWNVTEHYTCSKMQGPGWRMNRFPGKGRSPCMGACWVPYGHGEPARPGVADPQWTFVSRALGNRTEP